jgi:hypothetical protein
VALIIEISSTMRTWTPRSLDWPLANHIFR